MQKINFQNLPSTTTPINATNLNAIQTNVENVFNGSEVAGNMIVEGISSKNMFNGIIMQGTPDNLTYNLRLHSDNSIKVASGETYTLSTNAPNTFQIRLANYQDISSFADATNYESDGSVTLTTTTSGSLVVLIKKTNDGTITPNEVANYKFQIEEGSSSTTYTPYNAYGSNNLKTENIVVGSIRSKNMFDKNSFLNANGGVGSYSPLDTGVRAITGGTGANQWLNFKLPNSLLGKRCTLSFKATPSSTNTPMVRIYYGSATNMTNTNANFDLYGSGNKSITNTFLSSFPSGTDAIYMLVYCNRDGSGFSSGAYIDYTNFQLEEGSTATAYTPYQNLDSQDIYTRGEQLIGTWIDGSNVYRKVITYTNSSAIGASGSVTNISIPHSTPNLSLLLNAKLIKGGYNFPTLSGGASVNSSTSITQVTSTTINLRIINDTWGASTWYIVIEYVK